MSANKDNWFVTRGDIRLGPFSAEEIGRQVNSGELDGMILAENDDGSRMIAKCVAIFYTGIVPSDAATKPIVQAPIEASSSVKETERCNAALSASSMNKEISPRYLSVEFLTGLLQFTHLMAVFLAGMSIFLLIAMRLDPYGYKVENVRYVTIAYWSLRAFCLLLGGIWITMAFENFRAFRIPQVLTDPMILGLISVIPIMNIILVPYMLFIASRSFSSDDSPKERLRRWLNVSTIFLLAFAALLCYAYGFTLEENRGGGRMLSASEKLMFSLIVAAVCSMAFDFELQRLFGSINEAMRVRYSKMVSAEKAESVNAIIENGNVA